ncbi:hypothetical protein NDU88_003766 [Pleurodeles waltl]|uniref:Uncharacterized protein n=1 Tax=Pleurodeles waltl TaxID=8319 RepID=A0AAV7KYZ6_PLEWA|nr:hypothetical protein NDU88_003766 [Pleurodeles waltl]
MASPEVLPPTMDSREPLELQGSTVYASGELVSASTRSLTNSTTSETSLAPPALKATGQAENKDGDPMAPPQPDSVLSLSGEGMSENLPVQPIFVAKGLQKEVSGPMSEQSEKYTILIVPGRSGSFPPSHGSLSRIPRKPPQHGAVSRTLEHSQARGKQAMEATNTSQDH